MWKIYIYIYRMQNMWIILTWIICSINVILAFQMIISCYVSCCEAVYPLSHHHPAWGVCCWTEGVTAWQLSMLNKWRHAPTGQYSEKNSNALSWKIFCVSMSISLTFVPKLIHRTTFHVSVPVNMVLIWFYIIFSIQCQLQQSYFWHHYEIWLFN